MYMYIVVNDDVIAIDTHITKIVKNIGLFREVKNHIEQVNPIGCAVDRAQSVQLHKLTPVETDWAFLNHPIILARRSNPDMTPAHFLADLRYPFSWAKREGEGGSR